MSSLSTSSQLQGQNNAQQIFKPPNGGDLTLRSSDGVDFLVRTAILKLASSVFDNMIATGTTKDTVVLTENASDASYLLRFIYPNKFPVAISPNDLSNCLLLAQKYDIEGAVEIIDEIIALDGQPHKPLSSDPIRAYQLAVQFNLTKTKVAVAPLIAAGQIDFCNLEKLPELSRTYPSLKLIRMMNLQAMRSKVLYDILFDFKHKPMLPMESDFFYLLSCGRCWADSRYQDALTTEGHKKLPTTWSLAWAQLAFKTLLTSPIDRSQFLFQEKILEKFAEDEYVCQDCLSRIKESYGPRFESWVGGVKEHLETQFERLELLYAI